MRRSTFRSLAISAVLSAALLLVGCSAAGGSSGSGAVLGKAIFTTGVGHAGPNITHAALGKQHTITHKPSASDSQPQPVTEGPWTAQQTVAVVRTGVSPEGNHLGGRMPVWQLDSQDASALAGFLEQL